MLFGSQQFLEDAMAFALDNHFPEVDAMKQNYEKRARALVKALEHSKKVSARMPEGGMFVMVDVRKTGLSGEEFARRLLAEAGYGPAKPFATKILISPSGSGQMQPLPMNEAVQQNLKDIGIEITFEVVEWNALLGLWREGARAPSNRGITAINISYAAVDPFTGLIRFLKSDLTPPAANNWGYFSDPSYDELITRIYATFDTPAQNALLGQLHSKVVDDALFLFVAHDLNPRAMSRRVQGFVQAQSWFQDLMPIRIG